jgi:hypothetical protein
MVAAAQQVGIACHQDQRARLTGVEEQHVLKSLLA